MPEFLNQDNGVVFLYVLAWFGRKLYGSNKYFQNNFSRRAAFGFRKSMSIQEPSAGNLQVFHSSDITLLLSSLFFSDLLTFKATVPISFTNISNLQQDSMCSSGKEHYNKHIYLLWGEPKTLLVLITSLDSWLSKWI